MRKTFGIILIVSGWLLALMILMSALPLFIRIILQGALHAYGIGYLIGTFLFHLLFGILSFFLVKKGIQLTKNKKAPNSIIDKIDSIN